MKEVAYKTTFLSAQMDELSELEQSLLNEAIEAFVCPLLTLPRWSQRVVGQRCDRHGLQPGECSFSCWHVCRTCRLVCRRLPVSRPRGRNAGYCRPRHIRTIDR